MRHWSGKHSGPWCPRVAVGDVEGPADDEGLAGAALGVAGVPCLQDLQRDRIQLADDNVAGILVRGIDSPEPILVYHEVDV